MYTPILRCRQNEVLAIKELSTDVKALCMPLLDLPAPSKGEDKANAGAYTERNIGRFEKALAHLERVFVDSSELEPSLRLSGGEHPLVKASDRVARAGTLPVPVTGLHRDAAHMNAAFKVSREFANGSLCLRLDSTDISTANMTITKAVALLSKYGAKTSETVLLLDLQSLFKQDPDPIVGAITRFLVPALREQWGGVIIGGYGMPEELAQAVAVREQGYIPRTELLIHKGVAEAHPTQNIWFGDYATLSPSQVELDWRLVSRMMSPKAIYALESSWLVVRGGPFSSHEDGYEQYYDIAAEIVALEEFSGASFSFGDRYIQEKAKRIPKPGNPSSWIKACVNHHITLTAWAHSGRE